MGVSYRRSLGDGYFLPVYFLDPNSWHVADALSNADDLLHVQPLEGIVGRMSP